MAPIRPSPNASDSLFHLETISQYVPLPPLALNTPLPAVCTSILSPLLLSYFAPARGIVLAYQNVKLSSEPPTAQADAAGASADGSPVLLLKVINEYSSPFLWATADFLVWRPRKGVWIEGRVTHQSSTHMTLSYLNAFPITVLKQNMPKDWSFHDPGRGTFSMTGGADGGLTTATEGYWVDGNGMPVDEVLRVLIRDWEIKADGGVKEGAKGISTLKLEGGLEEEGGEQRSVERTAGEASTDATPVPQQRTEKSKEKQKKKEKEKHKKKSALKKSALKKSKNAGGAEGEAMQVD